MRAAFSAFGTLALAALALGGCAHAVPKPEGPAHASIERGEGEPLAPIELPQRRSPPSPLTTPPDVPPALAAPAELTLTIERRAANDTGRPLHETIARSADRVLVERMDEAVEWLFVRNPIDPRRVAARLIDHRQRVIVEYDESELRMSGIARGWADVAALGTRYDTLLELQPTGRTREASGLHFVELVARGSAAPGLWWSEEVAVALPGGPGLIELRAVERSVDRARFAEPRQRFPGYASFDVADYRERHHEGAEDAASHRDAAARHAEHQ